MINLDNSIKNNNPVEIQNSQQKPRFLTSKLNVSEYVVLNGSGSKSNGGLKPESRELLSFGGGIAKEVVLEIRMESWSYIWGDKRRRQALENQATMVELIQSIPI